MEGRNKKELEGVSLLGNQNTHYQYDYDGSFSVGNFHNFFLSFARCRNKVIHILSYASLLFFKISLLCLLE